MHLNNSNGIKIICNIHLRVENSNWTWSSSTTSCGTVEMKWSLKKRDNLKIWFCTIKGKKGKLSGPNTWFLHESFNSSPDRPAKCFPPLCLVLMPKSPALISPTPPPSSLVKMAPVCVALGGKASRRAGALCLIDVYSFISAHSHTVTTWPACPLTQSHCISFKLNQKANIWKRGKETERERGKTDAVLWWLQTCS